jgi:hypothetical protein
LFLAASLLCLAQWDTPKDVLFFLREAAGELSNPGIRHHHASFLDNFDPDMPGYSELSRDIEGLVASARVTSLIEIAEESGDDQRRKMLLDWALLVQEKLPPRIYRENRRKLIRCTIEKRGKTWKFVAFEPIDFFKY